MNINKAFKILWLPINSNIEEVKRNYRKLAIEFHPDRYNNSSKRDIEKFNQKMKEINHAYSFIKNNIWDLEKWIFNFDFEILKCWLKRKVEPKESSELRKLWNISGDLQQNKKYGLAIRLLEIGINVYFANNSNLYFSDMLYKLWRDLGDLLFRLWIKTEWIKFLKLVDANYYLWSAYFEYWDYKLAIKYRNLEFSNPKTGIDYEWLYIKIVKAYFLLWDYERSIAMLENIDETKLFYTNSTYWFPRIILYSIYLLEWIILTENEMKKKYPISYNYAIKILKSYLICVDEVDKLINIDKEYKKFINILKINTSGYIIKDLSSLYFNIDELVVIYEDIFKKSYPKLLNM